MKNINITITTLNKLNNICVLIDDELVDLSKASDRLYKGTFQATKSNINLKIYNRLDTGGIFWILLKLFFYIISIFGIFDIHKKKSYYRFYSEYKIDLNSTDSLLFNISDLRQKDPVKLKTETINELIESKVYFDKKAKRMNSLLLILKLLVPVAIALILIFVFFF